MDGHVTDPSLPPSHLIDARTRRHHSKLDAVFRLALERDFSPFTLEHERHTIDSTPDLLLVPIAERDDHITVFRPHVRSVGDNDFEHVGQRLDTRPDKCTRADDDENQTNNMAYGEAPRGSYGEMNRTLAPTLSS